jgi:hypothetical protein
MMKNMIKIITLIIVLCNVNFVAARIIFGMFTEVGADSDVNFIFCPNDIAPNAKLLDIYHCQTKSVNSRYSGDLALGTSFITNDPYSAYMVNRDSDNFTRCNLTAGDILNTNCKTATPSKTGGLSYPYKLVINGNYAYFLSDVSREDTDTLITQCSYNFLAGIESASCVTNTMPGQGHVTDLVFSSNTQVAYFTNDLGLVQCNVNSMGINYSTCQQTPFQSFSEGYIAVYNNIAYVGSGFGWFNCQIDTNGIINTSTCTPPQNYTYTEDGSIENVIALGGLQVFYANNGNAPYLISGSYLTPAGEMVVCPIGTNFCSPITLANSPIMNPSEITSANIISYNTN